MAAPDLGRATLLERLQRETFDIAIIGGGITGAGIARDAAMRGLSVALVEKGDFASGTSSRSSRLVHGGLRYLRHRQIGLVREALHERGLLLRLAPHLVQPIPFILPVYRDSHDAPLKLWMGLAGYDVLAGTLGIGWHRALSREQALRDEPALSGDGLRAGFRYFDAITNDARLTLAVALSAVRQGAAAVNYVEAIGLEKTGGRIAGVHYRDAITGAAGTVRARVVISAVGPWTDSVLGMVGRPAVLRPTKGIHMVLPRDRLPVNSTIAFSAGERMIFAVPQAAHTYIGTTDTDFTDDPGRAEADEADVGYLIEAANETFTTGLTEDDIVSTWAGVRPLMRAEGAPSDLPRDYDILDGPSGLYTICGGKLTTFRSMAEHILNHVIEREGARFSKRPARCRTVKTPLPGGATGDFARYRKSAEAALTEAWEIPASAARRLVGMYGTEHVRVLGHAVREPELLQPLAPGAGLLAVEAIHAVRDGMAVTLEDFLHRRCDVMLFEADGGRGLAAQAAAVMARELGWGPEDVRRQVAAYGEAAAHSTAFRSGHKASAAEAAV